MVPGPTSITNDYIDLCLVTMRKFLFVRFSIVIERIYFGLGRPPINCGLCYCEAGCG